MEEVYKPKNKQDFDNYIVDIKDNDYRVYLSGDIEEDITKYSQLIELLQHKKNTIYFMMKSLGGNFHSAMTLYELIKGANAKTICQVFVARSAGSLIMLACDTLNFNNSSDVMIHEPQMSYNRNRLSQCLEYFNHNKKLWDKCVEVYKNFDKDIVKKLQKGNEVFYTYEDIIGLKK